MAGYLEPTAAELEESREPRTARQQLDKLEVAVSHLEYAAALLKASNSPDDELDKIINTTRSKIRALDEKCTGYVVKRRRPKNQLSGQTCTVFIDECGQHALAAEDPFPVFVLGGVIIRDDDYDTIDQRWQAWKADNLGAPTFPIHEPDIRKNQNIFRSDQGRDAIERLPEIIGDLDFTAIAVVINRADYIEDFNFGAMDASLPSHPYLLALDCLMERVVLSLDSEFSGAKATVVAEARGPREDAQIQQEFARLLLDGTSYIKNSWFRQQLHPGVQFQAKTANSTGLQLADLLARPVGEKVANPVSTPVRWDVFRAKLSTENQTKHTPLGLKVIPWRDRYNGLLES